MEERINQKNCSFPEHQAIKAITYCFICKIYMCNKCEIFHSKMFETHKQLCCAKCVIKIGNKKDAIHKDCNVCPIEEIKDEKINNLKENIKKLEELSKNLNNGIENLKKIFDNVIIKKEDIKLEIQKLFTKIRNELNGREEALLLEVDHLFEKNFIKDEIIKEGEKLPNKVKASLEKCRNINIEEVKLNSLINDCLNIEKDIKMIDNIKENINKYNEANILEVGFATDKKDEVNDLIDMIKNFGKIIKFNEGLSEMSTILNNDIKKQKSIVKSSFFKCYIYSIK